MSVDGAHGGVERLIHVLFGVGDVIVELAGDGSPERMDEAEDAVAFRDGRNEYADGEEVVDVAYLFALRGVCLGLAVDAVDVLGASGNVGGEACTGEFASEDFRDVLDVVLAGLTLGGEEFGDLVVLVGVDVAEGHILELPFDLAHPETVSEGSVDVEGFLCDLDAPGVGESVEGTHVMEAVSEFDEDDADVLRHGDEHLAKALGLAAALGDEGLRAAGERVELGEFRNAVDEFGYVVAEERTELVGGDATVLDDIVEERSGDGGAVEVELREVLRGGERVLDVGFAGVASLPVVGVGGKLEGAFNQIDAILR